MEPPAEVLVALDLPPKKALVHAESCAQREAKEGADITSDRQCII